uniref:Uncharacterized protein n=1 Tax=Macaca fascicularis TaxID=9541 RepID=A0A7N9CEI0_MACFA
ICWLIEFLFLPSHYIRCVTRRLVQKLCSKIHTHNVCVCYIYIIEPC